MREYGFIDITYTEIDHTVQAAIFGNGSIRVTSVFNDEGGFTGVSFSEMETPVSVGSYTLESDKTIRDADPLFIQKQAKYQLMFDNPKSIDVVIERLLEAKEELMKMQEAKMDT